MNIRTSITSSPLISTSSTKIHYESTPKWPVISEVALVTRSAWKMKRTRIKISIKDYKETNTRTFNKKRNLT